MNMVSPCNKLNDILFRFMRNYGQFPQSIFISPKGLVHYFVYNLRYQWFKTKSSKSHRNRYFVYKVFILLFRKKTFHENIIHNFMSLSII